MMMNTSPKEKLSANPDDYHYFGRYEAPVLLYPLLQNWGMWQRADSSLPRLTGAMLVLDGHMYYSKTEWEVIVQATINALESKNIKYFEDFFAAAIDGTQKSARFLKTDSTKRGSAINQIEEIFGYYQRMEYPWLYVLPMCQAIEDWFGAKLSSDTAVEILQKFFTPEKPTIFAEYQKKLEDVAKVLDKVEQEKQINLLSQEYIWVGMMHFWGEPNSPKKVRESLEQTKSVVSAKKDNVGIPNEFKWILPITQKATFYRQYFAELCAIASYQLHQLFKELSIDPNIALWLTPEDFFQFVAGQIKLDTKMIESRRKSYGVFNSIIVGEELQEMLEAFVEKSKHINQFTGTIASKGKATGFVKIILSPSDLYKMNQGDILVAHETAPDVVTAMQKSGAIVTDIGGLTSHAAIVSRELGKPCIIGTKIATQVLKDGDRIEVDADKGVVRILG